MGKVIQEFETLYEVGAVVVFKRDGIQVGIIEGYYVEDNCFWFNIRISLKYVYTYTNGGDIGEFDIVGKLEGEIKENCYNLITGKDS